MAAPVMGGWRWASEPGGLEGVAGEQILSKNMAEKEE